MSINHTSVLAKADFFHTCEYIHIQLANSNIVKTSDLSRKKKLAEVESEVGVKYWIDGTTGKTGFRSILLARSAEIFTLSQFFRSGVKSKCQGLLTFRIRYKVIKRGGDLSLLALTLVNISHDIFNFFA